MEETIKIFGQTQKEIGSLDNNLVLKTKGQIYIRYGKKYVELLDRNGNLKVSFPKVVVKIDSLDKMNHDGFYLFEDNLYVHLNEETLQITGIDGGNYIQYIGEQNLKEEYIKIAQKNIGLTFDSIEEAVKTISNGIVHVKNDLYIIKDGVSYPYKNNMELNSPLKEINNINDVPKEPNSAIVYKDDGWKYLRIITYDDFEELKQDLYDIVNVDVDEDYTRIDLLQYSEIRTISDISVEYKQQNENQGGQKKSWVPWEENTVNVIKCSINPQFGTKDMMPIGILSVRAKIGIIVKNGISIDEDSYDYIYPSGLEETLIFNVEYNNNNGLSPFNFTKNDFFDLVITKNIILLPSSEGLNEKVGITYKEGIKYNKETQEEILNAHRQIAIDGNPYDIVYYFDNGFENELRKSNKYFYVKLRTPDRFKFLIDHIKQEIYLQENYKDEEDGESVIKSINHLVLGDINVKYEQNTDNKYIGLYSDYNLLADTQFIPDQSKYKNLTLQQLLDLNDSNSLPIREFPRYQNKLSKVLCEKHGEVPDKITGTEQEDPYNEVVPPIRWIKKGTFLNTPLKEIHNASTLRILPTSSGNWAIIYDGSNWKYLKVASKEELDSLSGRVDTLESSSGSGGGEISPFIEKQIKGLTYAEHVDFLEGGQGVISLIQGNYVPLGYAITNGLNGTSDLTSTLTAPYGFNYIQKIRPCFLTLKVSGLPFSTLSGLSSFAYVEINSLIYSTDVLYLSDWPSGEYNIYLYYSEYVHSQNSSDEVTLSGFSNCNNINTVSLSNRFTHIGDKTFQNCSNLYNVILCDSVKEIGANAFNGCSSTLNVTMYSKTPPNCQSNSFPNGTTFYVPNESRTTYVNAYRDINNTWTIN